jgi:hypothetical protein
MVQAAAKEKPLVPGLELLSQFVVLPSLGSGGIVMSREDTAPFLQETKTQLQRELDNLRRIWAGIGNTLDTVQRGRAAFNESRALLSKMPQDQEPIVLPSSISRSRKR